MADRITVLLVDDHALVRRGFHRLLDDDETLEVVGEASNGAEAVQLADKLRPQVIVMDCQLPEMTVSTPRRDSAGSSGYRNSDAQHARNTLVRQALTPERAATF
jgi:DNA-binding NarL/FixJ family response regulator